MSLDLLALLLVAAGAVVGALAGALRQVVRLLALALAAVLAPRLAPRLADGLGRLLPERAAAGAVAVALAFAALFLGLWLVGRVLLRLLASEAEKGGADRGFGALLGGLQAALAAWMVVSLLALWGRPVGAPGFRLDPAEGQVGALVERFNLVELVAPAEARALREKLPRVREAVEAGKALQESPAAREALRQLEEAEKAERARGKGSR